MAALIVFFCTKLLEERFQGLEFGDGIFAEKERRRYERLVNHDRSSFGDVVLTGDGFGRKTKVIFFLA